MRQELFLQLVGDRLDPGQVEELNDADAADAAEAAASMVPHLGRSPWADLIGPVYGWRPVARILGVQDRQAVDARRNTHGILGFKTADGAWAYPAFGFTTLHGRARVAPGLPETIAHLVPAADGLAASRWLATPNRLVQGRRPIDVLDTDGPEEVIVLARHQADVWAGRTRQ